MADAATARAHPDGVCDLSIGTPVDATPAVVQDALRANRVAVESAELARVPRNSVKVEGADAEQMLKLIEALEELDDVSKVFSNFDIDATALAEAEA